MSAVVLIVDDDPVIRHLIATTLEDVSGFELRQAADGDEAIEVALDEPPTIIFLDIAMPRVDGLSACRALRERLGGEPRIVVLTATGADREAEARAAGADLFLTKPFSPLDLLRLVDDLGASRSAQSG